MHYDIEHHDGVLNRGKGSMRRVALACAALFFANLLALAMTPANSSEPAPPKITGGFPRFGADAAKALGVADLKAASEPKGGVALAYPKLDRLYQLYNLIDPATESPVDLGVVERDLATLSVQRAVVIKGHTAEMANGAKGAEWVASFDEHADRLYLAYQSKGGFGGAPGAVAGNNLPGLLSIDLKTFEHIDTKFPNFLAGAAGEALNLVGMEFDESTDTLLILQSAVRNVSSLGNSLMLTGWKAGDILRGGQLPQVTPRPIRACRRDPVNDANSFYLSPILVARAPDLEGDGTMKTWVMVPCYSTAYSTSVVIVRMDRATALDANSTQEKAVVAPAGVTSWAYDTTHGRLYLVNNSAETDAWVYEAASNAFVGIIALSPKGQLDAGAMSVGVDETSGRLYARTASYGLMISAAAQDPVPQADVYPHLSSTGAYRLLVDSKRNRVLSLPGSSNVSDKQADAYQVITVPAPLPPPAREDPDARTAQVDERPGSTVAQYGGNASAYGLRVLLARGVSGAIPSNGVDSAGEAYKNINSYCGFTDRELVLARVSKTEFSNTSRFAKAAGADVDNATVIDLGTPSRCDIYNSYKSDTYPVTAVTPFLVTTGVLGDADKQTDGGTSDALNTTLGPKTKWDYSAADCTTTDGKAAAGPNSERVAGPTSVDCTKDDEISATAESRLKAHDVLDVTVAKATSSTKVGLDKEKGLVSTATSRLEGVRIGPISIGYITSKATSFARGREKTAGTVFDKPVIGYVEGPGVPACTDRCDIDQVVKALNTALSGRAEVRRVTPEARLVAGSPGGYEAGVIKSEKQQASDNSLSGDKSVEIPALELVVYNDNARLGRARQLYQFAGVRVDSHYGIQVVGQGSACTTCTPDIGASIDTATGAISEGVGLPDGGNPLGVRMPSSGENVLKRFIRQSAAGANYSLRIIFSSPREAMVMATVWLLIWGPFVASRRRRALMAVASADPEGPLP